jgi:hypothetical protein
MTGFPTENACVLASVAPAGSFLSPVAGDNSDTEQPLTDTQGFCASSAIGGNSVPWKTEAARLCSGTLRPHRVRPTTGTTPAGLAVQEWGLTPASGFDVLFPRRSACLGMVEPTKFTANQGRHSPSTPPRTSRPNNSRPTTPIPVMVTSLRRWFMSTTAFPMTTGWSVWAFRSWAPLLSRYGNSWRGIAEGCCEHGAVGCPIYSVPPMTDTFRRRVPRRGVAPSRRVQRGSVMDMPLYREIRSPGVGPQMPGVLI